MNNPLPAGTPVHLARTIEAPTNPPHPWSTKAIKGDRATIDSPTPWLGHYVVKLTASSRFLLVAWSDVTVPSR